jgi:glycolate oxidase iron-sulfur subunit
MTQIEKGTANPIVHTVELLDWATGGLLPPALAGVTLRAPQSDRVNARRSGDTPDVGVW